MIRNYIKIALRNLWNNKVYTGINLLGLSIASAFCLLVYMYDKQERSFDTFHKNASRIYRLEASQMSSSKEEPKKGGIFSFLTKEDQQVKRMLVQTLVMGADLKNNFPEIEAVVRYQQTSTVIRYNNQSYRLEYGKGVYMEDNFFTVFDFPLIQGNARNVLRSPTNVVISESLAKRIFGKLNPIGQTLDMSGDEGKSYTVSGIAKDFPTNSSINYDFILPLEAHPSYAENMNDHSNNSFSYPTMLELKKNTDPAVFQAKLTSFSKTYFAEAVKEWATYSADKKAIDFGLFIRPLTEAHYNVSTPWGHFTNLENLYQLIALAIIILLIACVNYILLTLTNTISRSQEVGIRKSMGASKKHIVFQFLAETQMLVFFAFVAGLILCISCIPLFNSLTGANIDLAVFSFKDFVIAALGLFVVLGALAGLYPALVMSGMKPLNMLKKFSSVKLNPVLSRALVVVQYSACIALIISSLVISGQMRFMNKMQLGFDKEQVMLIQNPYEWGDPQRLSFTQRMSDYVPSEPAVEGISFVNAKFGSWGSMNGFFINDKKEMLYETMVDYDFFDFMHIPILKGRGFLRNMPGDTARVVIPDNLKVEKSSAARSAIVVNETLYNMLGKPEVGVFNRAMGGTIIGVCGNYHFLNSTQVVPPTYHRIGGKWGWEYACLRIIKGQPIPDVIQRVKSNWSRITSNQPFTFTFMDEEVKKTYESYTLWLRIINIATILAVLIACMGLFGLSALYAVNRTKEIGIRKVMGASVANIFVLLNKDIVRLVIVSFIIAVPLAAYFMNGWLQNFAFRIHLGWWFFLLAGAIGSLLAIAAVSYHSLKVSMSNPVDSLRTE